MATPTRPPFNNQQRNTSKVSFDECSFCKKKGHWKAQCPKLLNKGGTILPHAPHQQEWRQPSPQPQWRPGGHPQQRGYSPNTAAVVPDSQTSSDPNLAALAEQLQKFLVTQPSPYAMSTPSSVGLSPHHPSGMSTSLWVLDSGASHHMSPDSSSFVSICPSTSNVSVITADGTPMPLAGVGSIRTPHLSLSNVYCIPKLAMNLVSVSQLCDSGYSIHFSSTACHVQDPQSKKLIGTGRRQGGLYVLDKLIIPDVAASGVNLSSFHLNSSSSSFYLWHSRLGHVSAPRLKYLVSKGSLGSLHSHDISDCSGCKLAKFSALPFNRSVSYSVAPFDLIHSDVWGPAPVSTKGGSRYYVSFIDDYTRYCWVYLMKHRSDFINIYTAFRSLVRTQHSAVIKCFRCDLGGEYTSTPFHNLLRSDGTIHQSSCTDTPQQNGVAERKHRHIGETARSLLLSASVPSEFWGEAVLTASTLR